MPLLQLFLSLIFLIAFFIAFFVVAWYVALPLLVVWLAISGLYWLRDRYHLHTIKRAMNGCSLRQTQNKPQSSATIIDADYTELDY